MAKDFSMHVATIGSGLWGSPDGGETWGRAKGIWADTRVYGLGVNPKNPNIMYAGTDEGIFRSDDNGKNFSHLDSPMDSMSVWRIAVDPSNPEIVFAGTSPSAVYRSQDGGAKWEKLNVDLAEKCPNVREPRVTGLAVDPTDSRNIWVGVEVDGVRRSTDGGDSWSLVVGINDPDIHGGIVSPGSPKTVFVATPHEIWASTDGENWEGLGVEAQFAPMPYCRDITLKEGDSSVMFVATGDGANGGVGTVQRSGDGGRTWEERPLPVVPNTPIWTFATNAADPNRIVTCSHYGQVFTSGDGGDAWEKVHREFTEIRGMAWTPN